MRFFKLVEISEEEYIERTRILDFDYCSQVLGKANSVYPDDKNIYIAVDEDEYEIKIDMEYIDDEDDDEWEDE